MHEPKSDQPTKPSPWSIATRCLLVAVIATPLFRIFREIGLNNPTEFMLRGDVIISNLYLCFLLVILAIVSYIFRNRQLFYITAAVLYLSHQVFEKPHPFRRFDYEVAAFRMLKILIIVGFASGCSVLLYQFRKYNNWRKYSIMGILCVTTIIAILMALLPLIAG